MKRATRFLLTALAVVMIAAVPVEAATTTSTNAYTYFTYQYDGPWKLTYVYWNTKGKITSLDTEDQSKTFRVLLRGEFFTDTSCSSFSYSRPTCIDSIAGGLTVGTNMHVGDTWFIGSCEWWMGYRSFGGSQVVNASPMVHDSDCGVADCD